jgi:maltose alpha-D-glucosyltransferase/alpha-amylase
MQLYSRGIRRRLAPMLGNNRRRLELAFSLLFSLPGTPMMQYGDEIGMGDDLRLPERECARTPMQWTAEPQAGFSRGKKLVRPVITDPVYGYEQVNVAAQRRDTQSLLNWTERMIRMRKECPEISWGDFIVVRTNVPEVLTLRYDWRGTSLLTMHNFDGGAHKVKLKVGAPRDQTLLEVFGGRHSRAHNDGMHHINLEPYAWRWFRVGASDNTLERSDLDISHASDADRGSGSPKLRP